MKKKLSILLVLSLLFIVLAPSYGIDAKKKSKYSTYTHNKLFFSKKNLMGKKIKVKVFVSESMMFDGDTIFDNQAKKFIKKNKIGRFFYHVKVKRKGVNSYASPANLNVYFPKKGKPKHGSMRTGRKYTIYGKVIEYSDNTWDGYNVVGIKISKIK